MSVVSIVGAGEIGSAVAHALARRARVRDMRLVDAAANVAAGKALDIRQSGPIDRYDTLVSGRGEMLEAANADVIVLADAVADGEWEGERGLALVKQLLRAGTKSPFVFAGPKQIWLMEAAVREAGLPPDRAVGSAAAAMNGALRALAGIDVNGSGVDVAINVVGRPPAFTIGWSSATLAGSSISEHLPAHRMLAIAQTLKSLWPPKPQAIAAATALVVEGLLFNARRHVPAMSVLQGEFGERGMAALLPHELGNRRILRRVEPSLSSQERTEFLNALSRR
jgi:malate dehydrogenase